MIIFHISVLQIIVIGAKTKGKKQKTKNTNNKKYKEKTKRKKKKSKHTNEAFQMNMRKSQINYFTAGRYYYPKILEIQYN